KAKDFANEITNFNIKRDDLRHESTITDEHVKNNLDVRRVLTDRGIKPEELTNMQEPIYLDHNATTPVDKRVLEKMLPYFCEVYGNAASIDHLHGTRAKLAVDEARQTIAKVLGCRKESEIVFT